MTIVEFQRSSSDLYVEYSSQVCFLVIAVERAGKTSFVHSCMQYNGKWPINLIYVSKPIVTTITAVGFLSFLKVTGNPWMFVASDERMKFSATALSWQPMDFLVTSCKTARSFVGWDPRDMMLPVLRNL